MIVNGENTVIGQNAMLPVDLAFKGGEGQLRQGLEMVESLVEEETLRPEVAMNENAQVGIMS